jgi:hypothetical protein
MARPRGPQPHWRPTTRRQKGILADLVARYRQHEADDTLPRGPRGIFYDLRPHGMGNGVTYRKPDSAHPIKANSGMPGYGPMEAHPEAVREVLVLARRAGIVPESWVADGRAPSALMPYLDDSAEEVAAHIASQVMHAAEHFHLDPQRGQPVYVEVLCEAADLMPRLARVAEPYGVPVYSGGGFDGLKGKRAFADRALARGNTTVVLHVGDRDDHGDDIYIAAAEDAVAWVGDEGFVWPLDNRGLTGVPVESLAAVCRSGADGSALIFVRLALTRAQAAHHGLLDADGKAEADAIPVPVLDGWLTDALDALQDSACRDSLVADEREQRERVPVAIRHALAQWEADR